MYKLFLFSEKNDKFFSHHTYLNKMFFFVTNFLFRIQKAETKFFASFNFYKPKYILHYSNYQKPNFHFFTLYSHCCPLWHDMFFWIFGMQHKDQ